MQKNPVIDALYRLKRRLSGYVSYLAACEMNQAFSEYILYEPALRTLTACGFAVQCEVPCPGFPRNRRGDHKKLDFVAATDRHRFAIELKWLRAANPRVENDLDKLRRYRAEVAGARAFLLLFGRKSFVEHTTIDVAGLREQGRPVFAEIGVPKYGCRNYECTA